MVSSVIEQLMKAPIVLLPPSLAPPCTKKEGSLWPVRSLSS